MLEVITLYPENEKANIQIDGLKRMYVKTIASNEVKNYKISTSKIIDNLTYATLYYPAMDFSFAKLRNTAKNHSTAKWVLMQDNDERLTLTDYDLRLLEGLDESVGAIYVTILLLNNDTSIEQYSRRSANRLFRNNKDIYYYNRCHEQILQTLKDKNYSVIDSNIVIVHDGYKTSDEVMTQKHFRNYLLLIRDLNEYLELDSNWQYLNNKLLDTLQGLKSKEVF